MIETTNVRVVPSQIGVNDAGALRRRPATTETDDGWPVAPLGQATATAIRAPPPDVPVSWPWSATRAVTPGSRLDRPLAAALDLLAVPRDGHEGQGGRVSERPLVAVHDPRGDDLRRAGARGAEAAGTAGLALPDGQATADPGPARRAGDGHVDVRVLAIRLERARRCDLDRDRARGRGGRRGRRRRRRRWLRRPLGGDAPPCWRSRAPTARSAAR